jgi:PAS domain S-box-containing protein
MTNDEKNDNPASQTLLGDLIESILRYADNPGVCAKHVTNQIRELIGVRLVALVSEEGAGGYNLIGICPPRREADWNQPEIQTFISRVSGFMEPRFIDPATDPSGAILSAIGASFVIPLIVGAERVGMLVLLDLLDQKGASGIFKTLIRISPVLALILKNSFLYKNLEKTVEKRTEQLARSEELFRALFEQASDGIFFLDARGSVVMANESFAKLHGYTVAEMLRLGLDGLDVKGTAQFSERFNRVMDGEHLTFEVEHFHKDGHIFPLEVTMNLISTGNEQLIIAIHRDISERKRAEEEREKLQAQFNQAQKMESVGRLAGGVAHDFNNMLGIILGNTEMALELLAPAQPLHAHLEEIRKAAERSADLTRQLLAFARKQTIAPKVLDLNEIVEGMLRMLLRLIGEDINLAWLPGKNLWPVKVDSSQIDQILANLCVNARDAIAGVGKVTIETGNTVFDEAFCANRAGFVPGEYVLLAVSDDGCGMDKKILEKLFEPFFTTKEMGKGTGLGLATVYGIVRQNNGFVNVYSEPGQGTTFKIYFPRHKDKAGRMQKDVPTAPDTPGHETILVAEDEPAILQVTTMMLERLGYAVLAASTPGEAIRMAEAHPGQIHLLMTDVVMPEMNGRDLAKNLLSLYPDIKRLFMSGYTADVIAHQGVLDKGVFFIQKPFTRKDLAAKVRQVLDH